MDVFRIILRMLSNAWKDVPLSPRRLRILFRYRRRAQASRIQETDRIDRIRNPSKYRGL
jgi:hypothetical protein